MKIYLDLLFLQDVLVMSLILWLQTKWMQIPCKIIRILIISSCSSIGSICILYFFPTWWDNLWIKGLFSYGIVKGICGKSTNASIIAQWSIFLTMVFLLGGISFYCEGKMIIALIIFIVLVTKIITLFHKKKQVARIESALANIVWKSRGKKYSLRALVDTGHDVKTIYGEPVIFVKESSWQEGGEKANRMVRFQTIAGMQEKRGWKVKKLYIQYHQQFLISSAVIVTTPNMSEDFDAIIGYDLLEGGKKENGNMAINQTKS